MRFEAHITYGIEYADIVRKMSERVGWKYSQIDGDPVYGNRVLCYLTSHADDYDELLLEMIAICNEVSTNGGQWIRQKIEEIRFDRRL